MTPVRETQPAADASGADSALDTLIRDISTTFISLPVEQVNHRIEDGLRRLCEVLGIDFAILWQWVGPHLVPTHAHTVDDALRPAEPMQQDMYPWCVAQIRDGRMFAIATMEDFPPDAAIDRETCTRFGIKAGAGFPLHMGGEPSIGVLGLNALRAERAWPEALTTRLQVIAQVFTNALARVRHEQQLQQSEARLKAGADLAGLGHFEIDADKDLVFLDQRLLDLTGSIEPTRGLEALRLWADRVHADDRDRLLDLWARLRDGGLDEAVDEYRLLHPTNGERWLHHAVRVARRDASRRALHAYGVVRDITEGRQREEALRQSYVEIRRLKERVEAESDYLKAEIKAVHRHGDIVGNSAASREVLRLVEQVAPTGASVLVSGETGCGKELVAQAIHRLSPRRNRIMVKVNCAALPSGLIESELFGREKGAYTGALSRQVGRFEVANGSTLFLDEIGELSLELQAKLLRVLESGEFERLGSSTTVKVDVRIIAATNRNLPEEIRKGRFREDLYYRLNVFPIRVPPLRERVDDIPVLVWSFLEEFSTRMGKKITQVSRDTMEALQRHTWPGNVRELRNVIENGAIITPGDTLRVPMLGDGRAAPAPPSSPTLADSERQLILRALEATRWRVKGPKGAAKTLGLKPSTLYSRMKKLGIHHPERSDDDAT